MKIDIKEPSPQRPNDQSNRFNNSLFKNGRPLGYYRKRSCVYNSNGIFCGQVGNSLATSCSSCDKINDPTRNCVGNNTCCSNERCSRRMTTPNGLSPYIDVSAYEVDNGIITKRQPIPQVKTITAPRFVYNSSTTYRKQPYSYSITEMIRNQKSSYKEEQKKINYRVGCNCKDNIPVCINGCKTT